MAQPEMTSPNIELSVTNAEIPTVNRDEKLETKASTRQAVQTAVQQEQLAKQAVLKQALAMINVALVYTSGFMTGGLVSEEARLTDQERDALAAVWAPIISPTNPLTVAIVTTGGIIAAKALSVRPIYNQRKAQRDAEQRTGTDNRTEPGSESGIPPVESGGSDSGDAATPGLSTVSGDSPNPGGNVGSDLPSN